MATHTVNTTTRPTRRSKIGPIDDLAKAVADDLEHDLGLEIVALAVDALFSEINSGPSTVTGVLADGFTYRATSQHVDVDAALYFFPDELAGREGLIRFGVQAGDQVPSTVEFIPAD